MNPPLPPCRQGRLAWLHVCREKPRRSGHSAQFLPPENSSWRRNLAREGGGFSDRMARGPVLNSRYCGFSGWRPRNPSVRSKIRKFWNGVRSCWAANWRLNRELHTFKTEKSSVAISGPAGRGRRFEYSSGVNRAPPTVIAAATPSSRFKENELGRQALRRYNSLPTRDGERRQNC